MVEEPAQTKKYLQAIYEELARIKERDRHKLPVPRIEKFNTHLRNQNIDFLGRAPVMSAQSWAVYDCK